MVLVETLFVFLRDLGLIPDLLVQPRLAPKEDAIGGSFDQTAGMKHRRRSMILLCSSHLSVARANGRGNTWTGKVSMILGGMTLAPIDCLPVVLREIGVIRGGRGGERRLSLLHEAGRDTDRPGRARAGGEMGVRDRAVHSGAHAMVAAVGALPSPRYLDVDTANGLNKHASLTARGDDPGMEDEERCRPLWLDPPAWLYLPHLGWGGRATGKRRSHHWGAIGRRALWRQAL